jgi:hypothetical protein
MEIPELLGKLWKHALSQGTTSVVPQQRPPKTRAFQLAEKLR